MTEPSGRHNTDEIFLLFSKPFCDEDFIATLGPSCQRGGQGEDRDRHTANQVEKSWTTRSHRSGDLEVKLWQERAPCWWAMKNCAFAFLSRGRVGKAIVSNSENPPASWAVGSVGTGERPAWWLTKLASFTTWLMAPPWPPRQVVQPLNER